ncbi:AAA family ATPase [Candidatus Woesearchaeota archaeon]|nr:AAA family ATPase [Candidatus Woesearchaeota archaeon]MCF7901386.1 AAA family ATPase [Candidatus Woesearchaeota archaeon]MCF8013143.1 AAA family ATPase [Candidatus Woesearchaeota archaeon]
MGLFEDVLKPNQNLIKNEAALEKDYIPKELPYRQNEQHYLADCIKPLFQKRSGRNLFIHGGPGIGKTTACQFILRELEEETDDIAAIYVNCWKHNTTYKVLLEICNILGYKFTQNKKTFDLYDIISRILNKKAAAFIFDEIDQVEDQDFLYYVLEDIHNKTIFMIGNRRSFLVDMEDRLKSRMIPEVFEFRAYKLNEVLGIIKLRKDYAFHSNTWEQDAFDMIAQKTYEIKDIRSGLFLMKEAAREAEKKIKNKITKEHVQEAINKLENFTIKNTEELKADSKIIFEIVKKNSGKKIGDLFKIYQKEGGNASYKTFQRKISELEDGKFIKTKKQTGAGGNTTIVEKKITDF